MVQKLEVTLVDDLDGGKADETVVFGLDGARYVIDLSGKNAKKLRDTLARYVDAARRDRGARTAGRAAVRKPAQPGGPNTSEVREWAKAQGFEVSERGRVSRDLIVKFQEAH
ncbi:Lsr2 family protein [Actinocrinis puniceicyclus]|uniref:Lsr2 family protein n=1 Tax=Actinocrinis puniceicyclus TaxID=977794 RepID=A0A8J7WS56_9ACTN|nr:Lsr2 family protein [Actinocrinis puniceicyclus]MBS2966558.1 Lsr2 family protein [Actinocrinis puniceicyclus]